MNTEGHIRRRNSKPHTPTARCTHQKQNKLVAGFGPWPASWRLHLKNTSSSDFIIKYFFLASEYFLSVWVSFIYTVAQCLLT